MKKIKKLVIFAVIIIATIGNIGMAASAQTDTRASHIKSRGNIDFDNGAAIIYAADLTYLANEIDILEDSYKSKTMNALNTVGTYFKSDGESTFNQDENAITSTDAISLSFEALANGIKNSQNIPEWTYSGTLPGKDTETAGYISGAFEDNLSLGTAAWVEGNLVVGTGADNNSYYGQGYEQGYKQGYTEIFKNIIYYTWNIPDGTIVPAKGTKTLTSPTSEEMFGTGAIFLGVASINAPVLGYGGIKEVSYSSYGTTAGKVYVTFGNDSSSDGTISYTSLRLMAYKP